MRVGPPRSERQRADALACLLGVEAYESGGDRVREALSLADDGQIILDGLVAGWREGRAVTAALYVLSPDGSAFVWPPESRAEATADDAVLVLRETAVRAESAGCRFSQSAIEPDRFDQRLALEAAGFRFLTDLLMLQRPLDEPIPKEEPIGGRLVHYGERSAGRFESLIERTYLGSGDCPAFAGVRTVGEALASYRAAGDYTPARWRLVARGARDAAVILVNDRGDERGREIVYLGVVPEARRDGLGRRLVLSMLNEARRDGLGCVLTSVDAANFPAVTLYSRLGFFPAGRRSIFLKRREPRPASEPAR